ncbi:hypothetical protein B566_EDAN012425 [Ephemera danica]|nr:hypothetical protein B566_EDAN012425 [Ephemera danica]
MDDYYIFLNDVNLTNKTNHSYQVRLENLPDLFDVINVIKIQQKFNSKINFELYKIETMKPMEENTKESGKDGTIIGILLFVILVGIVVVFVLYRKHQLAKCNERRMPVLFRQSINDNNGESSPTIAALPMRPTAPPPAVPAPEVTPAANSTEPHTCRVAVSNLQTYVEQAMITGLLKTQHALFPRGQTQPWDEGRKQEHRGKNRYGNLVAYDHTRVVLQPLPKQPHSHYINANYIDGYNAPKYYIATQGPKDTTLNDFWRMIWQENVRVIVMLANLVEDGKIKCEKYWPSLGTKTQYGSITTRTITEDEFLDYTTRDFEVINAKQTRKVRHLHYTVWPDHGVPRYPHSLAKFLRLINEVATPPVVVHCSAGVGRTGTVILAHECYKMAKSENAVDCLALVSKMRSQRPNMVDNKAQYEIAHHLLIELLIIGDTSIPSEKFAPMLRKFNDRHELPRQYAILNEASAKDAGDMEDPEFAWPKERSRFPFIVPGSDFINAVHVDGVRCKNSFIATQLPLPGTRGHFWSMVFQHASAVLLLNRPDPLNDKNKGTWKSGRRSIPVVSMKTWPTRNILPNKAEDLVQVWHEVDRLKEKDLQVVVACYDGATACGLFLAAAHIFEEMKATQKVDVMNAVRCIRHSRSQFVSTLDQFRFLHNMILSYLDLFDSYANYSNY